MSNRLMSRLCSEPVQADLKAYLDHELAPLARLRVWRHLKTCARCAEELTMLQATHERLVSTMPDELPSNELRGRIRAQIEQAGLTDERIRKNPGRPGLIPRRVLPVAAVASVMVTAVIVYALVHPRLMVQLRVGQDRQQIGLASTQYAQDYDEKFSASKPTVPPSDVPSPSLVIGLRAAHPSTALEALRTSHSNASLIIVGNKISMKMTLAHDVPSLVSELQKLGQTDPDQVHQTLRLAKKHPGASVDITIRILPEVSR